MDVCRAVPRRGFTLIEIAIVMAIIAVLIAVSIPVMSAWMGRRHVSEAADVMAADLRTAASKAPTTGTEVTFGSTPPAGPRTGYIVFNGDKVIIQREISAPITFSLAANFGGTLGISQGVGVIFYRDGNVVGSLGFNANGTVACNPGGVVTMAGGEICVTNPNRAIRLRVTRLGVVSTTEVAPSPTPTPQNL